MTTSLCGCGQSAASPCDAASTTALERTRFFAGQILGPDDLTQDQTYFREKHRRHNRMLHGWGVVCGACVRRGQTNCEVIVEPGYIIGPWGDEIAIDRDVVVDLCRQGAGEQLGCCGESLDPWCNDTRAECREGTMYLAVRYAECQARPVRSEEPDDATKIRLPDRGIGRPLGHFGGGERVEAASRHGSSVPEALSHPAGRESA